MQDRSVDYFRERERVERGRIEYGQPRNSVNLNLNFDPPACTEGYLPPGQWRLTTDETFLPYYPAHCDSGPPINMRGMNYAPEPTDWKSSLTGGTP